MTEPTTPAADENQIIAERRAKLAELRARGPAFPNDFRRTHLAGDLHATYGHLERDALEQANVEVATAGRMMLKRVMGKVAFATVQDASGRIQFFVAKDDAGDGGTRGVQALGHRRPDRRTGDCLQDPERASCRSASDACG